MVKKPEEKKTSFDYYSYLQIFMLTHLSLT